MLCRWIVPLLGWLVLVVAQVMVLPRWCPIGYVPDLLLLAVVLLGFWKADVQAVGIGFLVGLLQGWLHGTGWWVFALSRSLAAGFAGWLRVQWLWQSAPAAGFCAAISTLVAEGVLALLLVLTERQITPLLLFLHIALLEGLINAFLGALVFWVRTPKEVLV